MELESEECRTKLKEYEVKNETEELAIKVLLAKEEEVVNIPGITDMEDDEIDELAIVIGNIRDEIGIKD
jgi:hypothetical protein